MKNKTEGNSNWNIELTPKSLFLIDAFGAMLSAFLLGIVLVRFDEIFGIPTTTLYFLSILPLLFIVYDFYSYKKSGLTQAMLLKGISRINLGYCVLSFGLAVCHFNSITILGWTYIIVEILIIIFLAFKQNQIAKVFLSKA